VITSHLRNAGLLRVVLVAVVVWERFEFFELRNRLQHADAAREGD